MIWRPAVLLLMLTALVASACSSTTTVQTGQRAVPVQATAQADQDDGGQDSDEPPDEEAQADDSSGSDQLDQSDGSGETTDLPERNPEQMNSLVADCEDGNDMACDILFQVTDVGSREEAIAQSCGGRGEPPPGTTFCTEGVEGENEANFFNLASPALPDIVLACEGGDMTACDFLFWLSPIDSEYEEIGNTCAGRVEVSDPDCRTQFGQ